MSFVLALDQGTTSSRAIVFDHAGAIRGVAQKEFRADFPAARLGRARPDRDLGDAVGRGRRGAGQAPASGPATSPRSASPTSARRRCCGTAPPASRSPTRSSGRTAAPPPPATQLRAAATQPLFSRKTGLVLDAYFSGTKLKWLLDHVPGARERAMRGELAFGTVDSWLIWNLTGGAVHVTDASNASRTLLFDIQRGDWDDELLALLDVPRAVLPAVVASSGVCADAHDRRRQRADRRHRRRPAGGTVRPGLPRAAAWPRIPTAPAAFCC